MGRLRLDRILRRRRGRSWFRIRPGPPAIVLAALLLAAAASQPRQTHPPPEVMLTVRLEPQPEVRPAPRAEARPAPAQPLAMHSITDEVERLLAEIRSEPALPLLPALPVVGLGPRPAPPALPAAQPASPEAHEGTFRYFGHAFPIDAGGLVFVIDTSGSMSPFLPAFRWADGQARKGSRLDRAREEAKAALDSLARSVSVDCVAFADLPAVWRPRPVVLDDGERASARAFLDSLKASGSTDTAAAVRAALVAAPGAAIVLLSDGLPSPHDKTMDAEEAADLHRAAIRQANQGGAVIHTIGFDVDRRGRRFLEGVAADNKGLYREVDVGGY